MGGNAQRPAEAGDVGAMGGWSGSLGTRQCGKPTGPGVRKQEMLPLSLECFWEVAEYQQINRREEPGCALH